MWLQLFYRVFRLRDYDRGLTRILSFVDPSKIVWNTKVIHNKKVKNKFGKDDLRHRRKKSGCQDRGITFLVNL